MEKNEVKNFVNDLNNFMYKKDGVMFSLHDDGYADINNAEKMNEKITELMEYFKKNDPEILPAVSLVCQYALRTGLTIGMNNEKESDDDVLTDLEELLMENSPELPDIE